MISLGHHRVRNGFVEDDDALYLLTGQLKEHLDRLVRKMSSFHSSHVSNKFVCSGRIKRFHTLFQEKISFSYLAKLYTFVTLTDKKGDNRLSAS